MSITLPANLISSLIVGGVTVENDPNYAVTFLAADYINNTLQFNLQSGTTSGANFSPGSIGPRYTFIVNAITGSWRADGTNLSGNLGGAALTSIQTVFKNLRNNAETFAVNQNLLPGSTQVPW